MATKTSIKVSVKDLISVIEKKRAECVKGLDVKLNKYEEEKKDWIERVKNKSSEFNKKIQDGRYFKNSMYWPGWIWSSYSNSWNMQSSRIDFSFQVDNCPIKPKVVDTKEMDKDIALLKMSQDEFITIGANSDWLKYI